jgi:hypothetical protein
MQGMSPRSDAKNPRGGCGPRLYCKLKARNASLRQGQTGSLIGRPEVEGQGDTDQAHKCATVGPAIGKVLPRLIRSLSE